MSFQTIINDTRNSVPSIVQGSNTVTLLDCVKATNSLPNWQEKVRRKQDASLPYTLKTGCVLNEGGVLRPSGTTGKRFPHRIDTSGRYKLYGVPQFPSAVPEVATRNRALASIKNQLSGRTGSVHAMAPLAECRELGGLVRQATLLSTNFVKACIDAKRTKGRSAVAFLQDTWLGFNFALSPLIGDVSAAGRSIAEYLARDDLVVRLRATATTSGTYSYTPSTSITSAPYGFSLYKKGAGTYTLSYRFVGGFELALASANDYSVLDQLGISFSQIPATAWELTAFSWLADYFVNIGAFLEDVFTSPPGDMIYLVENRMLKCNCTHSFSYSAVGNPNGITPLESPSLQRNFELCEFQRKPLAALPHIALTVKTADEISAHGITKLLNLLSVIKL